MVVTGAGSFSVASTTHEAASIISAESGSVAEKSRVSSGQKSPAVSTSGTSMNSTNASETYSFNQDNNHSPEVHVDDGDEWETVERVRGGKRRSGNMWKSSDSNFLKKTKGTRTAASRKKNANRKMVRDILSAVLDKVDEEVQRRKTVPARTTGRPATGPNGSAATPLRTPTRAEIPPKSTSTDHGNVWSLRDVVVGETTKSALKQQPRPLSSSEGRGQKREIMKGSPSHRTKGAAGAADQNTAPTYQETVSAVSTPSNPAGDANLKANEEQTSKASSSAECTDEAPQNKNRATIQPAKGKNPSPPLPTLLSPENADSAGSSVASSLEAPHTSHRHHHSNCTVDVNDVGFHLLDVCDRLSRDMCLFMNRRALALNARRRERGAILAALQDSVSSLWPRQCHVELYGSCATQLDLPSSDIDVVVMGLDRNAMMAQDSDRQSKSIAPDSPMENPVETPSNLRHSVNTYMPPALHCTVERVNKLAADLEKQAWAVQVNAIPTASVPVVKVLCDPSRLTTSSRGSWMTQHLQVASQAAKAAADCGHGNANSKQASSTGIETPSSTQYNPQQGVQPWRGSDVMNGLLSLDITFEGPEHGGVGSTEYSTRVVAEACQEAGVHPDATPLVQVVMVLKELLCQRKLNEPYSGGLSSYALLLLVVALVRERSVIREEIERVERQRRAMATNDANTSFRHADIGTTSSSNCVYRKNGSAFEKGGTTVKIPVHSTKDGRSKQQEQDKKAQQLLHSVSSRKGSSSFSWASIVQKSGSEVQGSNAENLSSSKSIASPTASQSSEPLRKPASFADAVSKKSASNSGSTSIKESDPSRGDLAVQQRHSINRDVPANQYSPQGGVNSPQDVLHPHSIAQQSYFGNGFNDVVEVLCSGETTAGKLLMHFLLFYGEHFDAQGTAIDMSGKHERVFMHHFHPYAYFSPYIQRRSAGNIDPITGMLTVDPIVIYDPLEGAENNNVARRCFAWNSVRWIFAQSYATLSSAVERSATPPATPGGKVTSITDSRNTSNSAAISGATSAAKKSPGYQPQQVQQQVGDLMDPSSPLLRSLISF